MKKAKKADKPKLKLVVDQKPPAKSKKPAQDTRRPIATSARVAAFATRQAVTPYVIPPPFPGVLPKNAPTMAQDDFIGSAYSFASRSYGANLCKFRVTDAVHDECRAGHRYFRISSKRPSAY